MGQTHRQQTNRKTDTGVCRVASANKTNIVVFLRGLLDILPEHTDIEDVWKNMFTTGKDLEETTEWGSTKDMEETKIWESTNDLERKKRV